jgi:YVTN family beta-propeller protein
MSNRFLEKYMYYGKTMALLIAVSVTALAADAAELQTRLRRPVAIATSSDHKWVSTANRDSGSVSVINVADRSVAGEVEVGGQLVDIIVLDDSRLLVLDEQRHSLALLAGKDEHWRVLERVTVPRYPVQIIADLDAERCFVSSLWTRRVTVVDFAKPADSSLSPLRTIKSTTLGFEPREICLTADRKQLVVAGAFQNSFAILDAHTLEVSAMRSIVGHNARGLSLSNDGKSLLVAHQILNPLGRSTQDDVHWGNMLTNVLATCAVGEYCDPSVTKMTSRTVRYLGEPGNAAGDPGDISVGPDGELAIALSGVNEIGIASSSDGYGLQRVSVGRRPSAIARLADGTLFVADTFSDSVSVIEPKSPKRATQISLGPQPKLSPPQSGEMLFYDSRLSHDGWMSCHSCHTDGHSNGQLNDNLSDGSFGESKRVPSLLGVSETGPWAWNGQVKTLEEQVTSSIEKTMQGTAPQESDVSALVAYLNSLRLPPWPVKSNDKVVATQVKRGEVLFDTLDCKLCHTPPTYTSPGTYDVGLGGTKFNPPSLRGVGSRETLFHDSRADSLTAVFSQYRHRLPRDLTVEEVRALVIFLKIL